MGILINKWDTKEITVSLLSNGEEKLSPLLKQRWNNYVETIKGVASKWEQHCDIKFKFLNFDDKSANVRIKIYFGTTTHAKKIGKELLMIENEEPNVIIGNIREDGQDKNGDILCCFGHILGLDHEHLHPESDWVDQLTNNYKDVSLEKINEENNRDLRERFFKELLYVELIDKSSNNLKDIFLDKNSKENGANLVEKYCKEYKFFNSDSETVKLNSDVSLNKNNEKDVINLVKRFIKEYYSLDWDSETIKRNFFRKLTNDHVIQEYDKNSIMHYNFNPREQKHNNSLSEGDKKIVADTYGNSKKIIEK